MERKWERNKVSWSYRTTVKKVLCYFTLSKSKIIIVELGSLVRDSVTNNIIQGINKGLR